MSRLHAHCRNCDRKGSRSEFFRVRPGAVPEFSDVCPVCQSENVDIADATAEARAARTGYGNTNGRDIAAA